MIVEDHEQVIILRWEFDRLVKDLNNLKASGIERIPVEFQRSAGNYILVRLFNILEHIGERLCIQPA